METDIMKSRSNGTKNQPVSSLFMASWLRAFFISTFRRFDVLTFSSVFFVVSSLLANAANSRPEVSNVTVSQRGDGSKLVDIRYKLVDADGDVCNVSVDVTHDGGVNWNVPASHFSGNVGPGVAPGDEKSIVWDCGSDLPGFSGSLVVRVCADDGPTHRDMVRIPGGDFDMGDHNDGMAESLPIHRVHVDPFLMDRYEVTNAQFTEALNWAKQRNLVMVTCGNVFAGIPRPVCSTRSSRYMQCLGQLTFDETTQVFGVVPGMENHPVVQVDWLGAALYANWRSLMEGRQPFFDPITWQFSFVGNGYRLPTEAEWEFAARGGPCRGGEHDPYCRFPWGDALDTSRLNCAGSGDPWDGGLGCPSWPATTPAGFYSGELRERIDYDWPSLDATYQTSDGMNEYRLFDMAGNVSEWVYDYWGSYSAEPAWNPTGPATGQQRVIRGGSMTSDCDTSNYWGNCRLAGRIYGPVWPNPVWPDYCDFIGNPNIGFRLVLNLE